MKPVLAPIYFKQGRDVDFDRQLERLKNMLSEQAEFHNPVGLGDPLPQVDAAVFPQFLGEAYRQLEAFQAIKAPIMVITSEFGTVSMWDWEICSYLRSKGVETLAPCSLAQTKTILAALKGKKVLRGAHLLAFQDNPGEGMQAEIFKRFYWWEAECLERMQAKFGVTVIKKSFRELAEVAKAIPNGDADRLLAARPFPTQGLSQRALRSAAKIYLAVKDELAKDPSVVAVGINCLNESRFSNTTPCLAWNLLFEEQGLIWGCEADVVSMLTQYILRETLGAPIMMTNLYPFLMGQAALKHERISHFPDVPDPDNHILAAHCGYFGVLPQSFSTEWKLVPKVLAIVDENASAIDARMAEGPVTLAKLAPGFESLNVVEGMLEGYVQYENSDCRNGAVLRVPDGRRLLEQLYSHHYLLLSGRHLAGAELVGKVLGLEIVCQ